MDFLPAALALALHGLLEDLAVECPHASLGARPQGRDARALVRVWGSGWGWGLGFEATRGVDHRADCGTLILTLTLTLTLTRRRTS